MQTVELPSLLYRGNPNLTALAAQGAIAVPTTPTSSPNHVTKLSTYRFPQAQSEKKQSHFQCYVQKKGDDDCQVAGLVLGYLRGITLRLMGQSKPCLLYTSDAADDTPC
eukprot:2393922-Amphidinium_carterae.1